MLRLRRNCHSVASLTPWCLCAPPSQVIPGNWLREGRRLDVPYATTEEAPWRTRKVAHQRHDNIWLFFLTFANVNTLKTLPASGGVCSAPQHKTVHPTCNYYDGVYDSKQHESSICFDQEFHPEGSVQWCVQSPESQCFTLGVADLMTRKQRTGWIMQFSLVEINVIHFNTLLTCTHWNYYCILVHDATPYSTIYLWCLIMIFFPASDIFPIFYTT